MAGCFLYLSVRQGTAVDDREVLYSIQDKFRNLLRFGKFDVRKFDVLNIFQNETGPFFFLLGNNLEIANFDSPRMADVEGVGGSGSKHFWLRIFFLFLLESHCRIFLGSASRMLEPGCRVFDVCENQDGSEFFLYEYDSEAMFRDHLATDHFRRFDSLVGPWVVDKRVVTYRLNQA